MLHYIVKYSLNNQRINRIVRFIALFFKSESGLNLQKGISEYMFSFSQILTPVK